METKMCVNVCVWACAWSVFVLINKNLKGCKVLKF